MREIKFRAWDSDSGKMLYPNSGKGLFEFTGVIHELHNIPVQGGTYTTKIGKMFNGYVMQYTGLKDKNGVGIYEGDRLQNDSGLTWIVKWDKQDARFHLYYEDGVSGVCRMNQGWIIETGCEIIGHIHENPELLEKAGAK